MRTIQPATPGELAAALQEAAAAGESIHLSGASSKAAMAGPVPVAGVHITTTALHRLRQYEPHDLTISVEAGMPWCRLEQILAEHRQMIPLDPPFSSEATVGGVVAANSSGPRRRLYGAARDLIIGMTFATLDGALVQSGGMVVKNVAGLDMAKLMVGSFGTLAAIAVVNFKLIPMPAYSRTFLREFSSVQEAFDARDEILHGVLQPAALDLLSPAAGALCGRSGWLLALRAGGNEALLRRYTRDLPGYESLDGPAETGFWQAIREFTPRFLAQHPTAAVVRASATLSALAALARSTDAALLLRAGNGVAYAHFPEPASAFGWMNASEFPCLMEFAPEQERGTSSLWPRPGSDFETMARIKRLFDPQTLLNRGRLYGRI